MVHVHVHVATCVRKLIKMRACALLMHNNVVQGHSYDSLQHKYFSYGNFQIKFTVFEYFVHASQ